MSEGSSLGRSFLWEWDDAGSKGRRGRVFNGVFGFESLRFESSFGD